MDMQVQERPIPDATPPGAVKLLLPVDATERSRWGAHYAMGRQQSGCAVTVALLFVAEPVTSWQVLRFRTQEEIRHFQAERGNYLLEDAAQPLAKAGIPAQMIYREGNIVFQILDVAEQLGCAEIVLPRPHPRWSRLLSPNIAREVIRHQRSVPVTAVDQRGVPVPLWRQ